MLFLSLPLDIWETIFELLPGQDLQSISKVPRLRGILAIARRSAHRLEVHRAGLIDVSRPGSLPLAQRVELLRAYRARWENLRWAEVIRLPPKPLCIYHFAGNVLVHIHEPETSVMRYLRLPSEGSPGSLREDDQLDIEHGIKTFSVYPKKNLLAILEEWSEGDRMPRIRLHIKRLDSTRDIAVPHNGQLKVCQPFTTHVKLDMYLIPEDLSYEIEQIGHHTAILFACYVSQPPGYCANFIMWDLVTQEQIVSITSWDYRSFTFLDHRLVLFGAIRYDPDQGTSDQRQPYLELIDPTMPTVVTTLELDKGVMNASTDSTVDISMGSGAGHEAGSLTGSGGIPFVSDPSRGIISVDIYLYHPNSRGGERFEAYIFVMDIEDMLTKVPSPSGPNRRYIEWKDFRSSAAMFSYHSVGEDRYRILSRHSYASEFRYASPIQPLVPEDPKGPRCFFVYDFNPNREASDFLPAAAEDTHPEMDYPRSAREITREVIGGLTCWRMRFDLPAAEEDVQGCHVALTDGGVVLFESSEVGEETITVFSMR